MSNKEELIEFLLEKQGYLKEGSSRLSKKVGLSPEVCLEALREAKSILEEEVEELDHSGMVLKSRWQNGKGDWLESYTRASNEPDLEEFKKLKNDLLNDLSNISLVEKSKEVISTSEGKYALEVNLPDFHFGKKDGLSIEEQASLYLTSINEIISRVVSVDTNTGEYTSRNGLQLEKIILPIGNDVLNSEGLRKSTTKGTPQDDNTDWATSFRTTWLSIVSAIKKLAEIAPVTVVTVLGNHDYERSFYLGELLKATFNNSEKVEVFNEASERTYITYGSNLLGYTHGDKIKPSDLPLIMATEVPLEFSKSTTRSWRLGHLHKHSKDEYRGIEVEFLPALCGSDQWHISMGYHSDRKAISYLWDFNGGKLGSIQLNK